MTNETLAQSVLFSDLFDKSLLATFDQPLASSDGGAILLKAIDRQLGLIDRLTASVVDLRDPRRIRHSMRDLLSQRVFAIACGYPDGNDADTLAEDPIQKLLLGRDPVSGQALASQPTISRLENGVRRRDLYRLSEALADTVVARHRRRRRGRVGRITLDLDVTHDPTHGAQQLSFFNGFYDTWCYLPLVAFLTFDDEPRQYLVAALLRPGNVPATRGVRGVLRRLIGRLRQAFPKAAIRVRLDGGFASAHLFDELEDQRVEYVVAMAKNAVLSRAAEPLLDAARTQATLNGTTAKLYGETRYQAKTWHRSRRVVIKAEVVCHPGRDPLDNPRFVVTNLRHAPSRLYAEIYCARGDSENRLKELHHELAFGRTSCSSFWANQLRVILTAAAFVLLQDLQLRTYGTTYATAQIGRLRGALLKLGVSITRSVRRLVLHFPQAAANAALWCRIAVRLGARAG